MVILQGAHPNGLRNPRFSLVFSEQYFDFWRRKMNNKQHRWNARITAVGTVLAFSGWIVQPAQGDPNAGLVAHWCFDDCTADDCANSYDGRNRDDGAACVKGPWNTAFEFQTTDIVDLIPITWDDSIYTNQAFTVAAWVKWAGPDTNNPSYSLSDQCVIFDGRGSNPDNPGNGMVLYVAGPSNDGRVEVHFNVDQTGQPDLHGNTPIPTQAWTQVAATFDSSVNKLRIYVNGQLDAEMTTAADYTTSNRTAAIGNNRWAPNDGDWAVFNGVIDEVRVYDRALTALDFAELIGGAEGACRLPDPSIDCLCNVTAAECLAAGGSFQGVGTKCPGAGVCIPTLSEWGVAVMAVLELTAGTIVVMRRRAAVA